MIKYIKRKFTEFVILKKMHKNATLKGTKYIFSSGAKIILQEGSTKNDIILGDNIRLSGLIITQHGGKVYIGNNTVIGSDTKILALNSIKIGNYCALATGITIVDNNNHPISPEFRLFWRKNNGKFGTNSWIHSANSPIIIGDNVWIGDNSRICKGVKIGENSIIAACSVVTKDVPPNTIVAGNPSKIVKTNIDKLPHPTSCNFFNEYLAENLNNEKLDY